MTLHRTKLAAAVALAATALSARSALAGDDLARLFPKQAPITVSGPPGLARLALPIEVLVASRSDLSDVRVFDASGALVPFVIDDSKHALGTRGQRVQWAPAEPSAVRRATTNRGALEPLCHEVFTVRRPEPLPVAGAWDLVFDTRQSHLVRDVVAREGGGGRELARGTLFKLAGPTRERMRLALPEKLPSTLEVAIDGEGPCLEPSLAFASAERAAPTRALAFELEQLASRPEPGRTVIDLSRAPGIRPLGLRLTTSTPTFHRSVEIRNGSPGSGHQLLGSAAIFRVASLSGVEELEVGIDPADEGDRLELAIDDGDSPPLEALRVFAIVEQPRILFDATRASTLRFGGGRARAPEFDLAGFTGTETGRRLAEEAELGEARLGPVANNPAFDPAPALAYLMQPGPALDTRSFSHRRRIVVRAGPEGTSTLRLGAGELGGLRADLGDLRVVDGDQREWPYLLAREQATINVAMAVSVDAKRSGETRFSLGMPAAPLELDQITLETTAPYVDRAVRAYADTGANEPTLIHDGRLTRRPGKAEPLVLAFPRTRVRSVVLAIDDGGDAPLVIERASARVASADVFLAAPAGEYWLVAGDPALEAPRYQMERARDLVLAVPSATLEAGVFEPNPRFLPRRRWSPSELALWISIVAAVVVLGGLTLRLARREEQEAEPEPEPEEGAARSPG